MFISDAEDNNFGSIGPGLIPDGNAVKVRDKDKGEGQKQYYQYIVSWPRQKAEITVRASG